jgi:trigger factor
MSLKIDQKVLDDHQVRLTVEVEAEALIAARRKAAKKIAGRVKIPGFRPGKAPYSVIEKQVGPEAIQEEAIDIVLDEVYPQVLDESGISPYGPGTLEKVTDDKEPHVYEFRVPLSPEVTLGDYKKIRVAMKKKKVAKKDIEGVLDNLREQQAVLEPVSRPAEEGDMVYIEMSANRAKADENGKTELLNQRRYPVVVEKKDTDSSKEWPFPGFSRNLIGLSANDEKELKHSYAEDSEFEDLQGEEATFKFKVEEIKDRVLPKLDDSFAKSVGDYEDVAKLREEVESSLKENFEKEQKDEHENKIVDKILKDAEIKFPPQMMDHEIQHYIEDLEPQLAQQGLDMDTYLMTRQMKMEDLREEVRPNVEERLKKSLVLMEVSKQEKIEVGESDIQELVQEKIVRLQELLSEDEARRTLTGEALQGLVSRTMTEEIITRTLAKLTAIALGEESKKASEKKSEKTEKTEKAKTQDSGEDKVNADAEKKE